MTVYKVSGTGLHRLILSVDLPSDSPPSTIEQRVLHRPLNLPRPGSPRATKIALAFLLILGYFLLLSFDGLRAFFTSDDGMNLIMMHGCFTTPIWRIVADCLAVCTPAYRPVGGLFYRVVYAFFHFDPLPFRVACYCLLTMNLALVGLLLRCISQSWEIAAIGTLLFSYHGMLMQLFYNTGTIYDLLCATFYFIALLFYIYGRNHQSTLGIRQIFALLALYSCALDSKEMATSFPVTLLAYELIYHGIPHRWSVTAWKRFRPLACAAALTAVFAAVKIVLPSPMTGNELYRPSLSPHLLLHNLSWYYNMLLYRRHLFSPHTILLVLASLILISWAMRSRTMMFGVLFAFAAMLPVLIIPPRDGFVLYLPLLGWSAWAGVLLASLRVRLSELLHLQKSLFTRTIMQALLFVALIVLLYPIHQRKRNDLRFAIRVEQSEMDDLLNQMREQFPAIPRGSRILFADDPFRRDDWGLSFLLRLQYSDPNLFVARIKAMPNDQATSTQGFQYVLAYRHGVLLQLVR